MSGLIPTFNTERVMDIAVLDTQVYVDDLYQNWVTEFLGKRMQPLKPTPPQQVMTPAPTPGRHVTGIEAPLGPPEQQPTTGGF